MPENKKKKMPKKRNAVAVAARERTGAGFMTNRNEKRTAGRKNWRKELQKLIDDK